MAVVQDGVRLYKVVVVGERGLATRLLEAARRGRAAEAWRREDGIGEPGEPVMDFAMLQVTAERAGEPMRAYLFGHGIAVDDFRVLGPATRTAMFKGLDRLVVALDGAHPQAAIRWLASIEDAFELGVEAAWPACEVLLFAPRTPARLALDARYGASLRSVDEASAGDWLDATLAALAPQ